MYICCGACNRWHESASWLKKLNFTWRWIYQDVQDTHAYAEYNTFLRKCTGGNKIKKLLWKLIKYAFLGAITKMHDHFIADWYIHANFTP